MVLNQPKFDRADREKKRSNYYSPQFKVKVALAALKNDKAREQKEVHDVPYDSDGKSKTIFFKKPGVQATTIESRRGTSRRI
ncbi:hypothetical protein, partial [Desulfosarcina sp.]|uniref:hypothetical protein n=1 Tax=Desulfosarcina sp. TaxID=2027861 RepID=UPI0039707613